MPTAAELIAGIDLEAAQRAIADVAIRTPLIPSDEISELVGAPVLLKAECLQRSGSFKLRGALAKIAALSLGGADRSAVVTASAGNHARALALAARTRGVECEVFMPRDAAVSKVAAVSALGASVHLEGDSVEDALELATARAGQTGAAFVHPFDDLDVIAGQATIGRELLEDVPDLARVLVPVGGGGLASGLGIALRRAGAHVELVGVQAEACAPLVRELALRGGCAGEEPARAGALAPGATIADGIAIKRPGALTMTLLRECMQRALSVAEDEIADAIVFLAEHARLVAEGAGAVTVAALLGGHLEPVAATTVAIVSGGNIDGGLFAGLMRRHETEEGRRMRVFTRVTDRPGGLAELLAVVAHGRANLIAIEHVREAVPLHVRETGVELTLETRGSEHAEELLAALRAAGYEVEPRNG
jgi:threonine dehydratase